MESFSFQVRGDFYGPCDDLKNLRVPFMLEPTVFIRAMRISFLEAPDDVSVGFVLYTK